MIPRISKFERRIVLAIFLCAVTPFLVSLFFVPQIIQSKFALSLHSRVHDRLEASAVFFKEFFDAKKSEYSARAETISKDPILIRAARAEEKEDVEARLAQVIEDNPEVRSVRVFTYQGSLLTEVVGPPERLGSQFVPKTFSLPLGIGDAPRTEVVFVLPRHHLVDRAEAEEVATLYATSLKTEDSRARSFYLGYIAITALVVILALMVGFLLARGVTKRIARLAHATERVAKGESGFTVQVAGGDEISELMGGFNRMIEEVAEARDRIVYLEKVSGWQEFARRLAHEIKNPLTPIRLSMQELKRRVPESDAGFKRLVDDASDVVEEEIGALTRLVDEFSQFARLPEVIPETVELGAFLQEFLSAYNNFESDASVTLAVPDGDVPVAIDRVLLKRVLANLVQNGIEAAHPADPVISIHATRRKNAHIAEISVDDNGPGIEAAARARIFEPYFTTRSEGTGLGLAIVKKIVLQHGGSISVGPSEDNGGARFTILLPLASEEDIRLG